MGPGRKLAIACSSWNGNHRRKSTETSLCTCSAPRVGLCRLLLSLHPSFPDDFSSALPLPHMTTADEQQQDTWEMFGGRRETTTVTTTSCPEVGHPCGVSAPSLKYS